MISATKMQAQQSYRRLDLCFILNYRNRPVKSTVKAPELKELIQGVTREEIDLLENYRDPPAAIIEEYGKQGWFEKTYETVKKQSEAYILSVPGPSVIYTPEHGTASTRIKITRLLFFYSLKGRIVPFIRIKPSKEQQLVIDYDTGVMAVNSGPGTGKTTTAAHKAARLMSEGVLVVSYTNAAVNNFLAKLLEIVNDIDEIDKKPGKKIWLATIDSISQVSLPKGQRKTDFDAQVEAAIRDHDQFASVFLTLDNRPLYQHLIVDEGQDVSNERYELLFEIYRRWSFKSLTVIGDPRQRLNIRNGGRYQEMLIRGTTDEDLDPRVIGAAQSAPCRAGTLEKPVVVKYHISYRFLNPLLLELCNHISSTRPEIHSALTSETKGERKLLTKYATFDEIASDILSKIQAGTKPASICIISPVTQKASATKTKFDAIRQILATNGVMTSDEYKGEMLYVTSIQSVKGLEFDHVYFIAASGFPTYMNSEYQDINDGQSMNFVINTRARHTITYLTDATMRATDMVPDSMTTGGTAKQVKYQREVYPEAIRSDDIDIQDYKRFYEHNMLRVAQEEVCKFSTESVPSNYLYEIVSASLALVKGKITPLQMPNEIVPLADTIYRDYVRRGMMYDMRGKDHKIHISESQVQAVIALRAEYDETDIDAHKSFKECMVSKPSLLSSMTQINDVVMKVSNLIKTNNRNNGEVKQEIITERIRTTSIITPTAMLIFSESLYLGALIKKRNPSKNIYLVCLQSGIILKIGDVPRPVKQYEYMINALFTITVQSRLVRGRGRYSLANVDHNQPWYFVDTEFAPRTWHKSDTIYDIALINGFDPYASIVTYLKCDPKSFNPFLNPNIQYSDLEGAPTADELYSFFCHIVGEKKAVIWYFSASHDIAPFYEQHKYYDKAREDPEKGDWVYKKDLDYEFTFSNARQGNAKGTQSELYNALLNTNIGSYRHIVLHTAVSDAVLLAEYTMTRELATA